jgi:K+-sensing histidine kinase KdpD
VYEKRKAKWDWRSHLTTEELATLDAADKAKARWLKLNKERAGITNRAIQRAKYAALPNR